MRTFARQAAALAIGLLCFAAQAQTPPQVDTGGAQGVTHTPLTKAARGQSARISATIKNQAANFTPLVFARPGGSTRYHGYPMVPRGGDRYQARIPPSFLHGQSFEYFIEVRHENGEIKSFGSAAMPYVVQIEEPKIQPARLQIASDPGAVVSIDGKEIGPAPIDTEVAPGTHTVSISHADGRGAETQIEASGGKSRKVSLPLPRAGGPGTLTLLSEPPGARVTMDDVRMGTTPFQGEISPGKHKLVVERDGYVKQEREVTFREGHDVEQTFSLTPLPKDPAVSIYSSPAGASVLIDGKQVGQTPFIGPLGSGRHQVVLRKQGRRELSSDFEMPEGRDLTLSYELSAPTASSAPHVVVTSKPDGATVTVDGEEVGQTPWDGSIKPGQRKLKISMAGFTSEEREIKAVQNREMEVSFALARVAGPAKVAITSDPEGAEVSVDNAVKGKAPLTLELEPGEHEIAATAEGFKGQAQKITVENGQQASLRLALAKSARRPESLLAVTTDPKGARLYVDGHLAGETPRRVKTTPGEHEVRVALDGFITRSAKVKLPQGKDFELRIAVSLKKVRGEEQRQGPDEKSLARARLKRAQSCDKQGDWDCALKYFQAVYDYKPVPELLFNIAQVRRKKGEFKEAALAYRAYLKERPTGQLSQRAEQLAKRCEEVAAGGEKNVAEDDTEPPKIDHVALVKAMRQTPLKIEAVITDNKSGVFNPQACWRNVYNTEYECAPLVLVGADKYAVEVPAKSVTDGFAYFLEAFDNASNGPARSGAPEVPHAVAIEDPVAQPALPAVAAVTPVSGAVNEALQRQQESAEGGQVKGDAPTDANAAAEREDKGAVTASSVSSGQPLANTTTNVSMAPAQVLVRQPEAAAYSRWYALVHVGADQAVQKYTDAVVGGRAGLELSRRVDDAMVALISADGHTAKQQYRSMTATPGGPTPQQTLSEQRYDVRGGYGYDFGPLLMGGGTRLTLAALGMLEYQRWQNEVYPADYFGLGVQGLGRYLIAGPFAVVGGAGITWNVLGAGANQSAIGHAKQDVQLRLGLEMAITERNALEISYRSDLITFDNDYRFTNGLSLGFGTSF